MAYQPAGNLTSTGSLAHLASVYYKKRGMDRLQKIFRFREACTDDMIPKQVGKTVQFFRYTNFTANTTATTEGTVGTSQTLSSRTLQATVSQYTSYITVSDLLQDTQLDPVIAAASELLGYQAGLSVDTITRNIIDAESGASASMLGATFRVADLRNQRSQLQAVDVEPAQGDEFLCLMHPFVSYDLVNDPQAGGLADIFKYTAPQSTALVKYEDRGIVTHVAGCKVVESTNTKFTAGSPNLYRVYIFGKNGVGAVDLEGRGPSKVIDPRKQRFSINTIRGGPQVADPEGVIGGAVSYNFVFTVVVLDGPATIGGSYRYRWLDAKSSIG